MVEVQNVWLYVPGGTLVPKGVEYRPRKNWGALVLPSY